MAETTKTEKLTGSAKVYKQLREDILRMDLAPGQPLDEVGLAERFSLSRSPIREALVKLAGEGLVHVLPNRSTIVSPINFQDLPRFLDTLDLLQRATHRLAAENRTEEELAEISAAREAFLEGSRESIATNNSVPHIERNYDFHMAIARACRNPYLIRYYGQLLDEAKRLGHMRFQFKSQTTDLKPEDLDAQHKQMVEAIARRDGAAIEELAHEHANLFRGQFMDYVMANHTQRVAVTY
ncbi:GntR family transcriptional regulator [Donghicola tyrosinivorans]|uniref:DNA-binding GntR family transcriptional regulator n=1 Tax=Donghicola tyrosinivorans TaxID=1652492 RepID=A0A2T0W8S1_9RHOB|nr:GntR family transcriptional regulator [Donghicola tyrosinivorans]PRY83079.1 DNA-binding GntR family transcriptional regulator [Donghicola tyrosinivorans]